MALKRTLRSGTRLYDTAFSSLDEGIIPQPKSKRSRKGSIQVEGYVKSLELSREDSIEQPTPILVTAGQVNFEGSSPPKQQDSRSTSLDRPAQPHRTNAPVKTPRGSRLVVYTREIEDSSPSKTGLPRPSAYTSRLLDQACAHLVEVDPKMQPLIEKHHCRLFSAEGLAEAVDPFQSLCSAIMAQQVSGAAAASIKKKFIGLFKESTENSASTDEAFFPAPAQVFRCEVPFLRTAGLSMRKAEYVKGLAEKFASGDLTAAMLIRLTDEELIEKLVAVRGLGLWSVQMFACFALKRMDIFSTGGVEALSRVWTSAD
ncbi:MAG: hypothetical protein Q9220_004176 [cf. Caloplaca sp. 1 TL-2023]